MHLFTSFKQKNVLIGAGLGDSINVSKLKFYEHFWGFN